MAACTSLVPPTRPWFVGWWNDSALGPRGRGDGTFLAALYLSPSRDKAISPRPVGQAGGRPAGGGASAGAAGGARPGPSRAGARPPPISRRRFGGDDADEYDVPDYVTARGPSQSRRRPQQPGDGRDGHRADGRTAARIRRDRPRPARCLRPRAAGYDGYDARRSRACPARWAPSPAPGPTPRAITTGVPRRGLGPSPGYAGETPGGYRRSRPRRRTRPGRRFSPRQVSGVRPAGQWRRDVPAAGPPYSPEDPAGSDFGAPGAGPARARPAGRPPPR